MPFPLPAPWPKLPFDKGGRKFGARRDDGKRLHAGCDLIAPKGTEVFAVADGVVIETPRLFYRGTWQVTVDHGAYVVRYCEVLSPDKGGKVPSRGDRVFAGQTIAYVGKMKVDSMLHFELYSGFESGRIRRYPRNKPYQRRADLMDPEPFLHLLRNHVQESHAPLREPMSEPNDREFSF